MPTATLDLYRTHRSEYSMPKAPKIVRVRSAHYLTIEGHGEPRGEAFTVALGALYGVAYTIRMSQKRIGQDYKVCKLEGLWWSGDGDGGGRLGVPPSDWNWKLLIRVPDFVTSENVNEAKATLKEKGRDPEVREVELEEIAEGTCVQMLHVGPYSQEAGTIAAMKQFAEEKGMEFYGMHHEIYVSDRSRVVEEKLKTILRIPVRRMTG